MMVFVAGPAKVTLVYNTSGTSSPVAEATDLMSTLLATLMAGGNPEVTAVACNLPGYSHSVDIFIDGKILTTIEITIPKVDKYHNCYQNGIDCSYEDPEDCPDWDYDLNSHITIDAGRHRSQRCGYQFIVE